MTQYLVTGGTGYLGRHLVRRLVDQGRQVRVMVRPGSDTAGLEGTELVTGDVTDHAALRRAVEGCQRVFHCAAETRDGQPSEVYVDTNVGAVTALLEMAPELGVERVVHTSHYFAIGRTGEPRMAHDQVAEEYWTHDPGDMHDAHELSKYDAENEVNQRVSLGEPVLALIPTMMYGPEARPVSGRGDLAKGNRIVAMLAEHAAGEYPGVPGDGKQLWNLVHVEDVAAGHVAAMDADGDEWPPARWGHWHYILGGENVTAAGLFEQFSRAAGCSPAKTLGSGGLIGRLFGGHPYKGRSKERFEMDSHCWAYTPAMAQQDWGYRTRPLAEGLETTVAWMRESGLIA